MRKLDRRVVRTRQLLQDALVTLLVEREYKTIKIQDITDEANLGRATFYMHYKDKDELLAAILDKFHQEQQAYIESISVDLAQPAGIRAVFEHAQQQADFYRFALNHPAAAQRLRNHIVAAMLQRMQEMVNQNLGVQLPLEPEAHYMAGGLLSLLQWWLVNDMPYLISDMEAIFLQMASGGLPARIQARVAELQS